MINWPELYDWFRFWLPICFGIAACFSLIGLGIKLLSSIKKERQISRDVQRAYRYFKRLVEQHKAERDDQ